MCHETERAPQSCGNSDRTETELNEQKNQDKGSAYAHAGPQKNAIIRVKPSGWNGSPGSDALC